MQRDAWKNEVKTAASGRWREILPAATGIDAGLLDGRNHPCPKRCHPEAGGTNRFSMVDEADGALLCRKCFSTKNGDGLAAIQWLNGCDFPTALQTVADHLGLKVERWKKSAEPDQHLEFLDWSDRLATETCRLWRRGVKPEAMLAAGCRQARYRERFPVYAFPVFGPYMNQKPIGWVLWDIGGQQLPVWSPDGKKSWVKMLTTAGSQKGLMGQSALRGMAEAEVVWKVEGPGDMLALAGIIPPELRGKHVVITNSAGANEKPAAWHANLLTGKTVYVVHDADVPGQFGSEQLRDSPEPGGAIRWAAHLARKAASCRNVELPYPIAATSGKDVRDWVVEGHAYAELLQLAEQSSEVDAVDPEPIKAENDPDRLARMYLIQYATDSESHQLLRRNQGKWTRHQSGCWNEIEPEDQLGDLQLAVQQEFDNFNLERQDEGKTDETMKVTRTLINNVEAALKALCRLPKGIQPGDHLSDGKRRDWIALQNGCLHVDELLAGKTDCLHPHDPEWFNFSVLPFDYDPSAKCPKWKAFLRRVMEGDGDRIDLLQEYVGYCLVHDTSMQSMLLLHGSGANGKSVFLAAAEALIGSDNCSHVSLEVLGERFQLMPSIHKLANIVPEVGNLDKMAKGTLKSVVAGEPIMVDRKSLSPIEFRATIRMIVACNNLPRFADRTDGIWRRLQVVPFRVVIPAEERVLGMDSVEWWQAAGELPGMMNWALEGLRRLRKRRQFTESAVCENAKDRHREEIDPAHSFLHQHCVASQGSEIAVDDLYSRYRSWCEEMGYEPIVKSQFGRRVRKCFPGVDTKQHRVGPEKKAERFHTGIAMREFFAENTCQSHDIQFPAPSQH